jgi:hypothetical protein
LARENREPVAALAPWSPAHIGFPVLRCPQPVLLALVSWLVLTNLLLAQRVQFPSVVPQSTPMNPTFQPPPVTPPTASPLVAPTFDPYANPSMVAPPANIPYAVNPQFPQGYAQPQTPQPILPQALPPATPGIPQQGTSLFPNGLPWQGSNNAVQYQNSDGTVAKLQRFLQQISVEDTWLYSDGTTDALGINRLELAATFGLPIFYNPDTPLLITPGFAFNWLDGPGATGADLPPRVYDAYIDAAWHPQLNQFLSADLGLRTGVWTDFEELTDDSIRILGRGLGVLSLSPQFDVVAGVWYLDRNDVKMLPAGGVHWRPDNLWDMYLVFPNPKIKRRSITVGASQWWVYFAGEYGGGRWTVERQLTGDDIDINDIRAIFGIEWETQTQARGHFEVGYVFDREIIFAGSGDPTLELDDTIMLRAGFDF